MDNQKFIKLLYTLILILAAVCIIIFSQSCDNKNVNNNNNKLNCSYLSDSNISYKEMNAEKMIANHLKNLMINSTKVYGNSVKNAHDLSNTFENSSFVCSEDSFLLQKKLIKNYITYLNDYHYLINELNLVANFFQD